LIKRVNDYKGHSAEPDQILRSMIRTNSKNHHSFMANDASTSG
jgi:hypothetical protein